MFVSSPQAPRRTFISASKISRRRRSAALRCLALNGLSRSVCSRFSPIGTKDAGGAKNRRPSARAVQKPPVAIDELAVRVDLAARAKVADQVPVQSRAVEAARLRIRGPEGQMHRPADLLVEERVASEYRHGRSEEHTSELQSPDH